VARDPARRVPGEHHDRRFRRHLGRHRQREHTRGLLGAYLVRRFANGRRVFDRARDVFKFTLLAALLSTTVSPTVGVTTLSLGGYAAWADSARSGSRGGWAMRWATW